MSTSRDLRSHVTDVVTCPICLELLNSPKSLPCLHTFCLKCIEGHCRYNEPGDEVACPVCRQKSNIPVNGVAGLVSNFFIAGLVEARKTAKHVTVEVPCEVCLQECDSDDDTVPVCTVYCVDCKQKLCRRCSKPHKRWKDRPHKVIPIGCGIETELIQTQGIKCDRHKDDDVRLYCFDCKINICFMCFAKEHIKQHDCNDIIEVASQCVTRIDTDLETLKERVDVAVSEISRFDDERRTFLVGVENVMDIIKTASEEMKQFIDAQANELLLEVQSLKTEKCNEIESLKDNVEKKLLAFKTFSAYCNELKLKGKPCDVTRAANDLQTRASDLLHNDATSKDYCSAPAIAFTSINIHDILDAGQNFIGKVMTEPSLTSSSIPLVTRREKSLEQQLEQSAETEHSLRQQIEVCHSQLADNDKMWTQKVYELEARVKQFNENDLKIKLLSYEMSVNDLERQRQELRKSNLESRQLDENINVKQENVDKNEKKLDELVEQFQRSEGETNDKLESLHEKLEEFDTIKSSLREELETVRLSERLLMEYTVPRVVYKLPHAEIVWGVTSLDDKLYVLRNKDKEQVEVYNTTTAKTLYSLHGVAPNLYDMTSCKHYRCLYIADYSDCYIHKLELNGNVTKLSVNNKPWGLSVTSRFTVLVTYWRDSKLLELTTEGKQLRVITLQPDILDPKHAIQLSNGQFVVCHGADNDSVCIVDTNGYVTQSCCDPRRSATVVGQLNEPYHLAVDKSGFIFVADFNNRRVLLLSPTLSFVREIMSSDQLIEEEKPRRLFVDDDTGRLYVAAGGRVIVVQL